MPKVPFSEREDLRKHLKKTQSRDGARRSNEGTSDKSMMRLCQPEHGDPPYQKEPEDKGAAAVTYKVEPCGRFQRCLPTHIIHQGGAQHDAWKETYYTCKYDLGISEGFGAGPPPVGVRVGVLLALALLITVFVRYRHPDIFRWRRSKPRE